MGTASPPAHARPGRSMPSAAAPGSTPLCAGSLGVWRCLARLLQAPDPARPSPAWAPATCAPLQALPTRTSWAAPFPPPLFTNCQHRSTWRAPSALQQGRCGGEGGSGGSASGAPSNLVAGSRLLLSLRPLPEGRDHAELSRTTSGVYTQ